MTLTLNQLRVGQHGRVISIAPDSPSATLLATLGLLPGTRVLVERLAPLGDPISIRFNGQEFSVRRQDAGEVVIHREGRGACQR